MPAPDPWLPEPGTTTTFGALLDSLDGPRDRAEDDLKSHLYAMRVSRIVQFTGPLKHDTPIERP
ncbi:MAG: hypothetical protein QOH83_1870 [Solirubrobacteraceae bacterium]|jgi:hypothetical protein|nr:hypothetical protein [Solirubrobacteraceae bacterium]